MYKTMKRKSRKIGSDDASDADDTKFTSSKYVGAFVSVDSMLSEVLFIVLM